MSEEAQTSDFVLPVSSLLPTPHLSMHTHGPTTYTQRSSMQFGKAKIERAGKDLTIVTLSRCVGQSLVAAEQLKAKYGIEAEVINLRSIKPMDVEAIIKSVKKTHHLMAVESGFPTFGVGAEVLALAMEYTFDYLDAPAVRITGAEVPTPYGTFLHASEVHDLGVPLIP